MLHGIVGVVANEAKMHLIYLLSELSTEDHLLSFEKLFKNIVKIILFTATLLFAAFDAILRSFLY